MKVGVLLALSFPPQNREYRLYVVYNQPEPLIRTTYDGAFRNGAPNATWHAGFDQAYHAINGGFEGSRGSSYTMCAGDNPNVCLVALADQKQTDSQRPTS